MVLKVLNEQLRLPTRYVERRVDHLQDLSRHCHHWQVTMQVRLAEREEGQTTDRPLLVSLGIFEKKRLPDLQVADADGRLLPTIRRVDRTRVLALLLLQDLVRCASTAPSDDDLLELASLLRKIIAANPATSARVLQQYQVRVGEVFDDVAQVDRHIAEVAAFVTFTHVFVWVDTRPGSRVILTYKFTERHAHSLSLESLRDPRLSPKERLRLSTRQLAMRLGLLAVPIRMRLNGANHAHSQYLMVSPPAGTEVEALYWRDLARRPNTDAPDEADSLIHESSHYLLACYHEDYDSNGGLASLDLRIHSAGMRFVWLLSGLLLVGGVAGVVRDRTQLQGTMPLLAFIPGGLLALITQRNSEFELRMSETVKRICLVLVALAGLFGIAVTGDALGSGGVLSDRHLGIALAAWAAPVFVLMTYISFRRRGPTEQQPTRAALLQWDDVRRYRQSRRRNSYLVMTAAAIAAVVTIALLSSVREDDAVTRPRPWECDLDAGGASPIDASSGTTDKKRLDRGGDYVATRCRQRRQGRWCPPLRLPHLRSRTHSSRATSPCHRLEDRVGNRAAAP